MDTCDHTNNFTMDDIFCNSTWDTLLCWPPTKAGTLVELPCPAMKGIDPTKTITKYCEENGEWEKQNSSVRWTNYTVCFTAETLFLLQQLQQISTEEFMLKVDIAKMIRIIEMIGLTASLLALLLSFVIYYVFRSLRNERTQIHIHLFAAVFTMVVMKLIICIDQIVLGYDSAVPSNTGFETTPFLCEATYIVLEYSKSCVYMWMFIEALHLYNAAAVTATKMSFKKYYLYFGWGSSVMFVIAWVIAMISKPRSHCWWGYNYNPWYWILEGPRILVLLTNTIYLMNIIKVVFVKLRRDISNEMEKIRKVTKATLALVPLLGITNYLSHIEPKLNCTVWQFVIYSFTSYFLNSFQGLFIALLYCLLNKEVKETVFNKIRSVNVISWSSNRLPTQNRRKEGMEMFSVESAALP